jgi:hypothetical protein
MNTTAGGRTEGMLSGVGLMPSVYKPLGIPWMVGEYGIREIKGTKF